MSIPDIGWMAFAFFCGAVFWWVLMALHGCPRQHVLPGEREIKKLSLRYGDIVVIKSTVNLPREACEDLRDALAVILPAGVKIMILGEDFSLEAVLRSGLFNSNEGKVLLQSADRNKAGRSCPCVVESKIGKREVAEC